MSRVMAERARKEAARSTRQAIVRRLLTSPELRKILLDHLKARDDKQRIAATAATAASTTAAVAATATTAATTTTLPRPTSSSSRLLQHRGKGNRSGGAQVVFVKLATPPAPAVEQRRETGPSGDTNWKSIRGSDRDDYEDNDNEEEAYTGSRDARNEQSPTTPYSDDFDDEDENTMGDAAGGALRPASRGRRVGGGASVEYLRSWSKWEKRGASREAGIDPNRNIDAIAATLTNSTKGHKKATRSVLLDLLNGGDKHVSTASLAALQSRASALASTARREEEKKGASREESNNTSNNDSSSSSALRATHMKRTQTAQQPTQPPHTSTSSSAVGVKGILRQKRPQSASASKSVSASAAALSKLGSTPGQRDVPRTRARSSSSAGRPRGESRSGSRSRHHRRDQNNDENNHDVDNKDDDADDESWSASSEFDYDEDDATSSCTSEEEAEGGGRMAVTMEVFRRRKRRKEKNRRAKQRRRERRRQLRQQRAADSAAKTNDMAAATTKRRNGSAAGEAVAKNGGTSDHHQHRPDDDLNRPQLWASFSTTTAAATAATGAITAAVPAVITAPSFSHSAMVTNAKGAVVARAMRALQEDHDGGRGGGKDDSRPPSPGSRQIHELLQMLHQEHIDIEKLAKEPRYLEEEEGQAAAAVGEDGGMATSMTSKKGKEGELREGKEVEHAEKMHKEKEKRQKERKPDSSDGNVETMPLGASSGESSGKQKQRRKSTPVTAAAAAAAVSNETDVRAEVMRKERNSESIWVPSASFTFKETESFRHEEEEEDEEGDEKDDEKDDAEDKMNNDIMGELQSQIKGATLGGAGKNDHDNPGAEEEKRGHKDLASSNVITRAFEKFTRKLNDKRGSSRHGGEREGTTAGGGADIHLRSQPSQPSPVKIVASREFIERNDRRLGGWGEGREDEAEDNGKRRVLRRPTARRSPPMAKYLKGDAAIGKNEMEDDADNEEENEDDVEEKNAGRDGMPFERQMRRLLNAMQLDGDLAAKAISPLSHPTSGGESRSRGGGSGFPSLCDEREGGREDNDEVGDEGKEGGAMVVVQEYITGDWTIGPLKDSSSPIKVRPMSSSLSFFSSSSSSSSPSSSSKSKPKSSAPSGDYSPLRHVPPLLFFNREAATTVTDDTAGPGAGASAMLRGEINEYDEDEDDEPPLLRGRNATPDHTRPPRRTKQKAQEQQQEEEEQQQKQWDVDTGLSKEASGGVLLLREGVMGDIPSLSASGRNRGRSRSRSRSRSRGRGSLRGDHDENGKKKEEKADPDGRGFAEWERSLRLEADQEGLLFVANGPAARTRHLREALDKGGVAAAELLLHSD